MSTSEQHARLLRLATNASLSVALTLVLAKAVAWWLSGSVSLLAGSPTRCWTAPRPCSTCWRCASR